MLHPAASHSKSERRILRLALLDEQLNSGFSTTLADEVGSGTSGSESLSHSPPADVARMNGWRLAWNRKREQ